MHATKKILLLTAFVLTYCSAYPQAIKIGVIDFFGNRKINSETIRTHINVREGDTVTHESLQPETIVTTLEHISGVKHASVNPICCDTAKNLLLYIGIGESDSVILKYHATPNQNISLPGQLLAAYRNFGNQVEAAVQSGQNTEDDSRGYALLNYRPARKEQYRFIDFAQQHFQILQDVLRSSRYGEQRAAAAEIIAYSTNRKRVVNNLLYAVADSDETVRNNATRSLGILAGYLATRPELKISVPATPFINMLHSIVWTDRNKGVLVLAHLTQSRSPRILQQIKAQALASIIEMAKWKDRGHALFSFIILGRLADEREDALIAKNYSKEWPTCVQEMIDKLH